MHTYLDYASDLFRGCCWISGMMAGGILLTISIPLAVLLAVGLVIGGVASVITLLLGEAFRQWVMREEEEEMAGALVSGIPLRFSLPGGWRTRDEIDLRTVLGYGASFAPLPEEIEDKAGSYPGIDEDAPSGLSDMDEGDVLGIEEGAVLWTTGCLPVDGAPYYDYSSPSDGFGPSAPILPPIDLQSFADLASALDADAASLVAENGGMDYTMTLGLEDMTREELVAAARAAGVRGASVRWTEETLIARIRSAGSPVASETVTATAALPPEEPTSPPPLKPARKRRKAK